MTHFASDITKRGETRNMRPSTQRRRHRLNRRSARHAAQVAVAFAVAALTLPAPAGANTMRYWSCQTGGGVPTAATGWSASPSWNYSTLSQNCSGGGPLQIDATPQQSVATNSPAMTWTYQAPPNTTIASALVRWRGNTSGPDWNASIGMTANRDNATYDGDHVLDNCQWWLGCSGVSDGWRGYTVNADRLIFGIGCGGSDGVSCAPGDRAHLAVISAGINLDDGAAPQLNGAASGSAVSGKTLAGSESLVLPLADAGVGISDVEVKLDGAAVIPRQVVDANGGKCTPIEGGYAAPVPCKLSLTASLSVPTAAVADGTHVLTATVWDAAGNAAQVVNAKVTTDNVPPPAIKASGAPLDAGAKNQNDPRIDGDTRVGQLLTAVDGTWNDVSAQLTRVWQISDSQDGPFTAIPAAVASTYRPNALQAGKYLRIAVTAVSKEGTTVVYSPARLISQESGGSLELLSANNGAGGDPSSGTLVPSKKRTRVTVGFKRTVRVDGRLVDAKGAPIVGGLIDVYETVAGGSRSKIATITTDGKGKYSYSPQTRSNRVIELQYSRQKNSTNYQSSQSLQVLVRAGIHIKLSRSHIGSYGVGVITGRVSVDGFPASGVRVEVFALAGGRRMAAGTVRTNGSGRFRWRYQYRRVAHGTVPLLVKVHRDPDMPALDSTSNIVRQRIG